MSDLLILSTPGLSAELDGDRDQLLELLEAEGERFLLAGGTITLETWSALTEISRDALASAGEGLRITSAAAFAVAMANPQVATMAAGGLGSDEILVRTALEASGDRLEKGVRSE